MTALMTRFQRLVLIAGAALVIWGVFLPWGCYHGWIYFCSRGLEFNVAVLRNISGAQIAFMALTAAAVYYPLNASQILKMLWQRVIAAVIVGALLFLVPAIGVVGNGGGTQVRAWGHRYNMGDIPC